MVVVAANGTLLSRMYSTDIAQLFDGRNCLPIGENERNGSTAETATRARVGGRGRASVRTGQLTRTFLNCHGSLLSRSSGNSRSRSLNGVQSVYCPTTGPRYGMQISRHRR